MERETFLEFELIIQHFIAITYTQPAFFFAIVFFCLVQAS